MNEQISHHLQHIERWIPDNLNRLRLPLRNRTTYRPSVNQSEILFQKGKIHIGRVVIPDIEQILDRLGEAPDRAVLLGVCDDNLPLLLDLSNPAPGAVLVIGDDESGKTAILRSLVISASWINKPEEVTLQLIADQQDEYYDFDSLFHCALAAEDPATGELINSLAQTVKNRIKAGAPDTASILIIDDLTSLLSFNDQNTYEQLYWLIRHGPRYQVWTVASLRSDLIKQVNPRFLTAFRTQLFGYMHDEKLASRLAHIQQLHTRRLEKGSQFYQPMGGGLLRFRVCRQGDDENKQPPRSTSDRMEGV